MGSAVVRVAMALAGASALVLLAPVTAEAANGPGATVSPTYYQCSPEFGGQWCATSHSVTQTVTTDSGVSMLTFSHWTRVVVTNAAGEVTSDFKYSDHGRTLIRNGEVYESHETMRSRNDLLECRSVIRYHFAGGAVQFASFETDCNPV